jgi:hypothetical protein
MVCLVLVPKEGRSANFPSAFRAICLLDEAGKIFEKILVVRLSSHLSEEGALVISLDIANVSNTLPWSI